jgi:hypothetical protein
LRKLRYRLNPNIETMSCHNWCNKDSSSEDAGIATSTSPPHEGCPGALPPEAASVELTALVAVGTLLDDVIVTLPSVGASTDAVADDGMLVRDSTMVDVGVGIVAGREVALTGTPDALDGTGSCEART